MRTLTFTLLFVSSLPAVTVGTFPQELKGSYTMAHGLPDDDVRCVCALRRTVYAGTAKGLAAWHGDTWKVNESLSKSAVDTCVSAGDSVYFTYAGGLHVVNADGFRRLASLPPGGMATLAGNAGVVLIAT